MQWGGMQWLVGPGAQTDLKRTTRGYTTHLVQLAPRYPNLRTLCPCTMPGALTDVALAGAELQHCSSLGTLSLAGCARVTCLAPLASCSSSLTSLDLSGCSALTPAELQRLVLLPQLASLSLAGCDWVQSAGAPWLAWGPAVGLERG